MPAFIDLTGKTFGRLRVVEKSAVRRRVHIAWTCVCACGVTLDISGPELRSGDTQSCGCLARELVTARNTTHNMSAHPGYQAWCGMKSRCAPNASRAADYYDRDIYVCEQWEFSFERFWEDMGPTWADGLTLDRIDNDGPYSPENCRWATYLTQGNNTRRNHIVETPKGEMTVAQAAREFGVNYQTLQYRLWRGVSGNALFAKVK